MTRNLEGIHRWIRVVVGIALVAIAIENGVFGAQNVITGVIGVLLLATALVSYCPLYTLLGISPRRPTDKAT